MSFYLCVSLRFSNCISSQADDRLTACSNPKDCIFMQNFIRGIYSVKIIALACDSKRGSILKEMTTLRA